MRMMIVYQFMFLVIVFHSLIVGTVFGKPRKSCPKTANNCNVINTKLGKISGIQMTTLFDENSFCGYRGIRFAMPPVGDLRFKAPVASGPWQDTLNATDYGAACIQMSGNSSLLRQSEDCLFLNVFVPNAQVCKCKTSKIPVIIYIFGGAFTEGSGEKGGPELLLNRCVILVTFNYRVGVFGFLPLGLREYSGNMALKDQYLAMKWVKEHISNFGGDKYRILLFGDSVGGASAGYHMLNENSRKLFNRVYSLGGSVLNHYIRMESNDLRQQLTEKWGVNTSTEQQMIEELKTIPTSVWLEYTHNDQSTSRTRQPTWAPVIENEDAFDPILTQDPLDIYQSMSSKYSEIPATIYTHQTMDMITFLQEDIANPTLIEDLNTNFSLRLPFHGFDQEKCEKEVEPMLQEIRDFYFGNAVINGTTIVEYVRMLSYLNFIYPIEKDTIIRAKKTQFPQRLQINNQKTPLNKYGASNPAIAALPGPAHGEDLCYYFCCKAFASLYEDVAKYKDTNLAYMNAYKTIEEFIDIVVSFAVNGNPVSRTGYLKSFPKIGRQPLKSLSYVEIMNSGDIVVGNNPTNDEFFLWWSIDQRVQQLKRRGCKK